MVKQENIRNFCIIAHIDHGKSTLADRILELTKVVSQREARQQYLDRMDLERERGITIKAQTVRLPYFAADGQEYELNLIDTPGHVDFNYEVSRSLAACEGALLVVDATQGVEAQTLANVYLALDHNHEVLPVLNKIDLPSAEVERVKADIEESIGLDCSQALSVSAKTGMGVDAVLEAIVNHLPAPRGDRAAPLKALIFDSWYDSYQGVVVLFRVMDGVIRKGEIVRLMSTGKDYEVLRLGVFSPEAADVKELLAGGGDLSNLSIKQLQDAHSKFTMVARDEEGAIGKKFELATADKSLNPDLKIPEFKFEFKNPFSSEGKELDALKIDEIRKVLSAAEEIVKANIASKTLVSALETGMKVTIEAAKKVAETVDDKDENSKNVTEGSRVAQRIITSTGNAAIKVVTFTAKTGMDVAKAAIDYAERSLKAAGQADVKEEKKEEKK